MEELVDVLDINGNKTGIIEKKQAHKLGLWHRVVHIWVINSKRQVLIQKRCSKKSFYPNVWDVSVGGHVGAGESSISACLREVYEEIGLKLRKEDFDFAYSFLDKMTYNGVNVNEIADVFIVKKDVDISDLNYQEEEVETAKWIDFDLLKKQCKSDMFLPHLNCYDKLIPYLEENYF